jgi:hypothetical protein
MSIHVPRNKQTLIRRLPDQITLRHGPRERLGRFFLAADKAARDRGVILSLSTDFELLREVNRMNLKHWYGLPPTFDSHYSGIDGSKGFWLIGRNEAGEIISTQAAHYFDMADTTLEETITSLRLFYADPQSMRHDGESCTITAPSARRIRGNVVYSGCTWIHPDYRRRHLAVILPRISRALAYTRWNTDYTISFVSTKLVEMGVAAAYGYRHVEPAMDWYNSPVGPHYQGTLVWMPRAELLGDLERFNDLIAEAEERESRKVKVEPARVYA